MFAASVTHVPSYTRLQQEFTKESCILRFFMVPWSIELFTQLKRLANAYIESTFDVWSRQINDVGALAKEYHVLCHCMLEFYDHLAADLARLPDFVQEVREALMPETMKFQREIGVLSIRSLIKEDVFIPLLFIPVVEGQAEKYVHGGERKEFQKPVIAKDQFEAALASSLTITDSLMPAVVKMAQLVRQCEVFFGDVVAELLVLGSIPTSLENRFKRKDRKKIPFGAVVDPNEKEEEEEEDPGPPPLSPEDQAALDAKRKVHYEIVRPKAFWILKGCLDLEATAGNINEDLELTDDGEKAHALEWLETKQNASGTDIIDVARANTRNVEISDAMDPN